MEALVQSADRNNDGSVDLTEFLERLMRASLAASGAPSWSGSEQARLEREVFEFGMAVDPLRGTLPASDMTL